MRRHEGQTDAHADRQRESVDDDRASELGAELLDQSRSSTLPSPTSGISTANSSPPRRATTAASGADRVSCSATPMQDHVAGLVTETIVDLLEAVEVEQQDHAANIVGVRTRGSRRDGCRTCVG